LTLLLQEEKRSVALKDYSSKNDSEEKDQIQGVKSFHTGTERHGTLKDLASCLKARRVSVKIIVFLDIQIKMNEHQLKAKSCCFFFLPIKYIG